ncbi:putative quinol monooxygenase [Dongshaea marina]|uniref:putative quinol monooxygenase n=1 Tax=Dongshaea marina TaxID=2047966 RepID=UPI000D3E9DC7|nr:antibiotic biosynthesis monooxygenase [Dongshaea marina]
MSKKIYCVAQFQPKEDKFDELFTTLKALEPDTLREDGCIQYVVTKHIPSPFAEGDSYPIAFQEIWASNEAFEAHCQKDCIREFFEDECAADSGLVDKWNVCIYTDE